MVFAEVGFDDLRIGLDFGGRALGDLHAVIEDGDALAHAHDDFHRVLHEEDGEVELFLDLLDEADELHFLGRVHAGGGLVEEEQLRLGREAADDFEPALFAIGKALRGGVAEAAEIKNIKELLGAFGDRGFVGAEGTEADERLDRGGRAVEIAGDADVVEDGEGAEEANVLKRAGDAELDDLIDTQSGNGAAVKRDGALGGLVDAGDEIEDGGLAGAVGADEADELVFAHGESDGVDGGEAAETDRGLVELEEGGHGSAQFS